MYRGASKLYKAVQPAGEASIRIALIAALVGVLLVEINQECSGVISRMGVWIWENILVYKTVIFGLGMLTTYLLMRWWHFRTIDKTKRNFFNTAPIRMDVDALELHAKEHGIQLDLRNDPRISKRNPESAPPAPEQK